MSTARIELLPRADLPDPQEAGVLRAIELALPELRARVRAARVGDVYWVRHGLSADGFERARREVFFDPVLHAPENGDFAAWSKAWARQAPLWGIEKRLLPGVTDNRARTVREAFAIVGAPEAGLAAVSGTLWVLAGDLDRKQVERIASQVFCNPLIEGWNIYDSAQLKTRDRFADALVTSRFAIASTGGADLTVRELDVARASAAQLEAWNQENLWALNARELTAIAEYFRTAEKGRKATDVELEMLAQTWSEHCKHKIFGARITYAEAGARSPEAARIPAVVDGVFKQTIAATTRELARDWCLSVFKDNAGVIALTDEWSFCMKVETHNSPSALDPFGGALTGIVGVNRDILGCGLGARPILNTDVFCVAPLDTPAPIPQKLLHPRRILSGVRMGVEHGGNQSGIPTVGGALVFDPRFLGKPLVYCGTGGLLPRVLPGVGGKGTRPGESKEIRAGDRIGMCGGRIGKDGIHGATFSSLALDESSPLSAVQLGDPITQKRMTDFLMEARDRGLYRALTDNGAGGLSSSVGEMAELAGGARVDLSRAPTKYPGLKPFEIWVSESQERMTLAVPAECWKELAALAALRGVELSDLGEFTASGRVEIFYGSRRVGNLALTFLHGGAPKLEIEAVYRPAVEAKARMGTALPAGASARGASAKSSAKTIQELLPRIVARPNVASKEWLIRQYDHEVQGTSVIKPLTVWSKGSRAVRAKKGELPPCTPNDAAVIQPLETPGVGIAVGMGIRPRLSDIDPWVMAQAAVDEAVRNTLCVGAEWGDPAREKDRRIALIDNFCWPDLVSNPAFAAALVRAAYGMREAALALGAPFISGKDSMKNDFRGQMPPRPGQKTGERVTISVPPTLLMTCVARVPSLAHALTADFKGVGDVLYLLGHAEGTLGLAGSEAWDALLSGGKASGAPTAARLGRADWNIARGVYGFLGGVTGKGAALRAKLRSAHDVSEGGLLTAVAESLFATPWGARIALPEGDALEQAFGEGFHRVVVSVSARDAAGVEKSWRKAGVAYARLGIVTREPALAVETRESRAQWKVSALRQAWSQGPTAGYWQ